MVMTASSCKQCARGFKWNTDEHDEIPDYCSDCRNGNPPTKYYE